MRSLILILGVALATTTNAQVHIVNQSGLTFIDSVSGTNLTTIAAGTTIQWVWGNGNHTVTNGAGSSDPQSGLLFDSLLNSGTPTFSYTFSTPGTYPYYCIFHEAQNHNGVVVVNGPTLAVSSPQTGVVDIDLTYMAPGNTWLMLISLQPQNPTGSGPLFGIGGDAWPQLFAPVLSGVIPPSGTVSLSIPGVQPGVNLDAVVLQVAPGPVYGGRTEAVNFITQ